MLRVGRGIPFRITDEIDEKLLLNRFIPGRWDSDSCSQRLRRSKPTPEPDPSPSGYKFWLKDPRRNPAYRALHHPSSGKPPEFHGRHRRCGQTGVLHGNQASHGARLQPGNTTPDIDRADPTHTDASAVRPRCRLQPHVICECSLYEVARERILGHSTANLSPNIIFGTRAGGKALAQFIEATQACMRPQETGPRGPRLITQGIRPLSPL
jgi:hypothetical protein